MVCVGRAGEGGAAVGRARGGDAPSVHAHPPCATEYFLPAGILLKCFLEVTDREIYDKLVVSACGV